MSLKRIVATRNCDVDICDVSDGISSSAEQPRNPLKKYSA